MWPPWGCMRGLWGFGVPKRRPPTDYRGFRGGRLADKRASSGRLADERTGRSWVALPA